MDLIVSAPTFDYIQPSLYRHGIQRKNIALKLQATYILDICENRLTEAILTSIQNICSMRK